MMMMENGSSTTLSCSNGMWTALQNWTESPNTKVGNTRYKVQRYYQPFD